MVCSVGIAAEAANMNYLGDWVNAIVSKPGRVVVHDGGVYYSLKSTKTAPNRNYIPSTNPTWWQEFGTVGNTILNGVVDPTSAELGQVGDSYLNTASNALFGPKTASAPYWPATDVALSEAVGELGAAGATGPADATGPQGPEGTMGFVVKDSANTIVGSLFETAVLVDTPDGKVAMDGFLPIGPEPRNQRWYESTDCSGTAYIRSTGFFPAAGVVDNLTDFHAQDPNGNPITVGYLVYSKSRSLRTMQSYQVDYLDTRTTPYTYTTTCAPMTVTDVFGIIGSTPVSWSAPFSIVQ